MTHTRRDLARILPVLLAASPSPGEPAKIASFAHTFDELPARTSGPNITRPIVNGLTHTGYPIEVHETELAPGKEPHPPHHHAHEEMLVVIEGNVDYTVNGKTTKFGPGAVGFAASMDEHGVRNNSDSRARYVVIAFRGA